MYKYKGNSRNKTKAKKKKNMYAKENGKVAYLNKNNVSYVAKQKDKEAPSWMKNLMVMKCIHKYFQIQGAQQ